MGHLKIRVGRIGWLSFAHLGFGWQPLVPVRRPTYPMLRNSASGREVPPPPFLDLRCLINSFRFLDFLLWFVLGPGGLREAPGVPGNAHGGCWGSSRGLPELPGPGFEWGFNGFLK